MNALLRRAAVAVIAFGMGSGAAAQRFDTPPPPQVMPFNQEMFVIAGFEARVADYVAVHRMLEGPLPPLRTAANMTEVHAAMAQLAGRIRAVRGNAHQGDLITPEVAIVFKHLIATCLKPAEWEAILTDLEGQPPVRVPPLEVNMTWPAGVPYQFMPPHLLTMLPRLPPELHYQILGRSLVLWDDHADMIVDFLPQAFPSSTTN
jgi:hypothetical protein